MDKMNEQWRKATRSGTNGACVEVRAVRSVDGAVVEVRDTKARGAGPTLTFTREEWVAFADGMSKGEFEVA